MSSFTPSDFREHQFDGIVGPTHNYAGLSPGNLASQTNMGRVASPRAAALQGLAKARVVMGLGIPQHVLPPQERPDVASLRALGFTGSDAAVIERAAADAPDALAAAMSASSMWAANAATVSPSPDTRDARLHLTPANLAFNRHRALEGPQAARTLRAIFADDSLFTVHEPLPVGGVATPTLFDEGAANHTRLTAAHGRPGVELFVHGFDPRERAADRPRALPPRQSAVASEAVVRRHGLAPSRAVHLQQHHAAIDAGVFHNDVISVGNENVLLLHERAHDDAPAAIDTIRRGFAHACGASAELHVGLVTNDELSIEEAVRTYLFNSQLLTLPDGGMLLLAPSDCNESPAAVRTIERLVAELPPLTGARYVDVRESMRNGGGPACLRLRVVMSDEQAARLAGNTRLTPELLGLLEAWVAARYRESLAPADLADPALLTESRDALDELTRLLGLGVLFDFQR